MGKSEAPLTRMKHGSVRCAGCSQLFSDDPHRPVVLAETTEQGWSGVDSAGQFRRSLTPTATSRKWHTDCLAKFEQQAAENRERSRLQNREAVREVAEAAGLDVDTVLAQFDERNPPLA